MWFKHSMSITQQLMPIYNTTAHKNKSTVALNVANVCASYSHKGGNNWIFNSLFDYNYSSKSKDEVMKVEVILLTMGKVKLELLTPWQTCHNFFE